MGNSSNGRIVALRALSEEERRAISAAGRRDNWQKSTGKTEIANRHAELGIGLEADTYGEQERHREEVPASIKTHGASTALTGQAAHGGLMSLVDLWETIKPPSSHKTADRARLCVRRFINLVGDLEPDQVTREHVIAYRGALEKLPGMSALNTGVHLGNLHALFNVALSEGVVATNPAYMVKARKTNSKFAVGRQGFTSEQVQAIFKALDGEREDFRWVVRLLAYHGMRSGEACQLRCDDVTNLHGVPVLRVHDRHGRVKNRASVRDIPIHPECIGIVSHASQVAAKHGAESWLFVTLPAKRSGRAHWFHDYGSKFLRRKVGITDRRYTMHSFRHLWRTLARECEMPDSVSRSIMGHSLGRGEHDAYGSVPSLKLRARWIAGIDPLKA